jgi:hypothetical protein
MESPGLGPRSCGNTLQAHDAAAVADDATAAPPPYTRLHACMLATASTRSVILFFMQQMF